MGQRQSQTERYREVCPTDQQAAQLAAGEMKEKTGADVHLGPEPSGRRNAIVRGQQTQMEAAARFRDQKTGAQANTAQTQLFWLQWVEAAFPALDSGGYFLPPVYKNCLPKTVQSVADEDVVVVQSASGQAGQSSRPTTTHSTGQTCLPDVADSDIRDDAAMQRLLYCLKHVTTWVGEVCVVMSSLQFGQYLGEPCYAAAAAQLPLPAKLPPAQPRNWKQGDFDVLLIHRHYGLVVCEVKAFGDNIHKLNMSQQDVDNNIRQKLRDAVSQLDKAEAMLSHLVSDIAPGLRITKTIAFPNLTAHQLQQAISGDNRLIKKLCRCLGTSNPVNILGVCLCSDQLCNPETPWYVNVHVLEKLQLWWKQRVTVSGPDSHMTHHLYKTLVARLCGPATTVSVPCTCPPRVSVKTLGQAVWCTGECYTAVITLFPEQVSLLNKASPRVFVTGPPGTGKTVVLLLMAIQWLRCGHHVYVVSTWRGSRTACTMLYHLLLQTVNTQQSAGVTPGQPHLLQYRLDGRKNVKKAVNDLSQLAMGESLYVIADEVIKKNRNKYFHAFCELLLTRVPRFHLWAASCYHGHAPAGWKEKYLTRPIRSPPAVVREVEKDMYSDVKPYCRQGVSDHTDGPPVRRLYHGGQGHSRLLSDCVTCGREVANFLLSLRVGVTESGTSTSTQVTSTSGGTTTPCLQWRDVLVLDWYNASNNSGMVKALRKAGIPVRVMKDKDIEDVATACSDVVWVSDGRGVRGLERKVVVCLQDPDVDSFRSDFSRYAHRSVKLEFMSRCTSQLVIVYHLKEAA